LRQLSLSGAVGNVIAIVLYLLVGMIPLGLYGMLWKKKKVTKADNILVLLSVFLLVVIYFMINPGLMSSVVLADGRSLFCCTWYSVLLVYFVLRGVEKSKEQDLQALQKMLRIVLYVVMVLLTWAIVMELLVNLPANIKEVKEGNTMVEDFFYEGPSLVPTYVFLFCRSVIAALPNGLSIAVLFFCIKTLDVLLADSYCEKAVSLVKRVGNLCKKSLVIVVIAGMGSNVAQILFSSQLYQISIELNIPIMAVLFLLVIHIMARFIEENQKLKADNELFI
jgi:hypothetical protein